MTDKQIIIDGVDVSECKHFGNRTCLVNYLLTDMTFSEAKCELCKDCYFKQLTRKEQECEELKEKVKELRQGWVNCDKERNLQEANSEFRQRVIDRYEQKLERIKIGLKEIFYCLIKANRGGIISDTIWVNNITTLWDYMANLLELQGDQNEIEKQIIDEVE